MVQSLQDDAMRSSGPGEIDQRSPVVELRGITKAFGGVQALTAVDLTIYPGEVLGLLGENGAGKSTLVKILTGVLRADNGDILIDGEPEGT